MDASRFIGLALLALSLAVLSNQMATKSKETPEAFQCPLMDFPRIDNETLRVVHNISRTVECVNGREMAGCCVERLYCNLNSSHIDLSLYGPPGYRMTCSDICCPQKYILPIPLPNLVISDDAGDDDSESGMDMKNSNDSDSDEN